MRPQIRVVDGRRHSFLSYGQGDAPALLLHGLGGSAAAWLSNLLSIGKRRRTIALDLPAHGQSDPDLADPSPDGIVRLVDRFLEAEGIEDLHLVGHSYGGAIALGLAALKPNRVASLTLIAPAGVGPLVSTQFFLDFMAADDLDSMRRCLSRTYERAPFDPDMMARATLKLVQAQPDDRPIFRMIRELPVSAETRQAWLEGLGRVRGPVQVIWGREDRILPVENADVLRQYGPVHVLDSVGHLPHLESAAAINALIEGQAA